MKKTDQVDVLNNILSEPSLDRDSSVQLDQKKLHLSILRLELRFYKGAVLVVGAAIVGREVGPSSVKPVRYERVGHIVQVPQSEVD